MLAVSSFGAEEQLVMLTSKGYIKRTTLSAFANIRVNGLIAISLEEGDALRWVRLALPGDSVLIGSLKGMTIHFRLSDEEIRPLGRTARGVRSMNLRGGDCLVSMDVLPAELADRVAEGGDEEEGEGDEVLNDDGPWVLVASASGLGKRVPVQQFRLQKRAGMGLRAIRFRREGDVLIGLKVLGAREELLLVSEKGVIVRMQADAVPQQSRAATGVRLQRLDTGDRLAEVVLVPPAAAGVEPTAPVDASADAPMAGPIDAPEDVAVDVAQDTSQAVGADDDAPAAESDPTADTDEEGDDDG